MKLQQELNPAYMDAVKDRTEGRAQLTCLAQAAELVRACVPPGASCLDVGGASGYFYDYVRGHVGSYCCVDNSPAYLEYGRAHYAEEGGRVSHVLADVLAYDPGARFDAVVCLGLFYTFPDFRAPLERLMALTGRALVIRALFAPRGETRYVPVMEGARDHCYYNIFGYSDVTGFALSRGFAATWSADRHRLDCGGQYSTAGLDFPFAFLTLTREALP